MNQHYPTIKQLIYFLALVEHNHFGKAADSCFVSQSAFSVAIKDLENALGGQLVDRTNKQVTVTNLGREINQQAQQVMREMNHMLDIAKGQLKPLSGNLSMGIIPTISPFVLGALLPLLQKKQPDLDLDIHEGQSEQIYQQLMQGQLDVILLALPYEMRSVQTHFLWQDDFCLISSEKSQWLNHKPFDLEQVADGSVLLLEDGHCLRDHALSACHIKHIDKVSQLASSSLLTLVELVKQDLGISFVPEMALQSPLIKQSGLSVKKLPFAASRDIGLAWRQSSTRAEEFKQLGELIKEACQVS
ncbi:hydrogen peroxide-inducible genes activator [Marinicella rhabdoformis]|uniref:hydrogen peroxide-inducible genes activator n=1 Tax=Marinicella rhabdoformis TaxID=2580566 RepID=UPI0012AEC23A|nr:hydrogen peroxide-inducible genes activator [Marinicella rhabdoformis]